IRYPDFSLAEIWHISEVLDWSEANTSQRQSDCAKSERSHPAINNDHPQRLPCFALYRRLKPPSRSLGIMWPCYNRVFWRILPICTSICSRVAILQRQHRPLDPAVYSIGLVDYHLGKFRGQAKSF